MVKWVIWMVLTFPGILMATYEQQGQTFGEQMLNQGVGDAQETLNQMSSEWSKQGNSAAQTEELKSSFEAGYDSGKKGEDPLKSYFSQKTVEASKNKESHQPSLGDAELLLKQKHRFEISPDDPLFKRQKEICEAEVDKEGIFQKGQPEVKGPELKDKIVTCRIGSAGVEKSCVKTRVINFTPAHVRTIGVVLAVRAYESVTFTVNFLQNAISAVNAMPTNTDYKHTNNSAINNKDGIIAWSGITQSLSNTNDVDQINFISSDNGSAVVLQHPSSNNGYVGIIRFAPSGDYMNVLKAHLNWQVVGYPNFGEDTWQGCEELERQAHEGFCELVSDEQQGINESRMVEGYPALVTREYWTHAKIFNCGAGRDIDTCKTLLDQGCEQINSQCVETKNGLCIEYENTFKCEVPDYLKGDGLAFKNGQLSFMKEPSPYHEGYDAGDFGQAITQFNALTEMGKKLQDELGGILGDPDNPSVFHGKCNQCRVNFGSFFRDCCRLKGILQGLFGQCSEEEKKLAVAAIKNQRCVKVGDRYCHKKLKPFGCREKRDSYCCYGSKLARIIQEIVHYQLNIPWGDAEHPNCGPLTAEQLSEIDFDATYAQDKLAEVLAEVQATAQEKFALVQNAVANMGNMQDKINILQDKQTEEFSKKLVLNDRLEIPGRDNEHYNDIKKQHAQEIEKRRKLKKIREYQTFEKQLNTLEDKLGITEKSWGIPKEGTSDNDLLHWFDNVVGEPGVDAHIEGIYKPRLKTYQKIETTTPDQYTEFFIQTFGDKFDKTTIDTQYQNANGQRRKLLIESLDLSSPHRALLNAAATGDLADAQKAVGSGAHVKAIQENGYTALQLAIIFNRDITLIDYLIKQGSDLSYKENDQNKTALELAEIAQRQDVVELIRRSL